MEWIFFAAFIAFILVVAAFAIRWAIAQQNALVGELANDPEYMAVPRGNTMPTTGRAAHVSVIAKSPFTASWATARAASLSQSRG